MTTWKLLLITCCIPFFLNAVNAVPEAPSSDAPTVLLAILARNKAHTLPTYLKCLDNLDYDKKKIFIYINTNNNSDQTQEILKYWSQERQQDYASIEMDIHTNNTLGSERPHEWNPTRFKALALIRNKSMAKAVEKGADFYFVVDCDNFIAPQTLSYLVAKNKPIIAPMLQPIPEKNDIYSNFFRAISPSGYYETHPEYIPILSRAKIGTFEVPVVHCTYLIRRDVLSSLTYIDGTEDYEFVIFSREARKNNVAQFICNEQVFGSLLHFKADLTLDEEKARFEEVLSSHINLLHPEFQL